MDKDDIQQLVDAMNDMASILSNYYLELKRCGFSDQNAIKLTISYQESLLGMASKNSPE